MVIARRKRAVTGPSAARCSCQPAGIAGEAHSVILLERGQIAGQRGAYAHNQTGDARVLVQGKYMRAVGVGAGQSDLAMVEDENFRRGVSGALRK